MPTSDETSWRGSGKPREYWRLKYAGEILSKNSAKYESEAMWMERCGRLRSYEVSLWPHRKSLIDADCLLRTMESAP